MRFDIDAYKDCFKTETDEAYFWHGRTNGCGGQDVAMAIASENNGKSLEMCMLDHRDQLEKAGVQFLNRPDGSVEIFYGSNQQEYKDFWENCSKAFAEQSSGDVHVIEGTDPRPNGQTESDYPSVYNRIEHPILEQNQNVSSIIHINPCTNQQIEVEAFPRQQSNALSTEMGSITSSFDDRKASLEDLGLSATPVSSNNSASNAQAITGGMM